MNNGTSNRTAHDQLRGVWTQRHVDALFSISRLYARENCQQAPLATGVTLEFVIHQSHCDPKDVVVHVESATTKSNPAAAPTITGKEATVEFADAVSEGQDEDCEKMVLIMGLGVPKEAWAPVVDFLLEKWQQSQNEGCPRRLKLLTFDNRGCGRSQVPKGRYKTSQMAQDTLELLDYVKWPTAHVVGLSMGGMIAQEIAVAAPERVLSLSLISTAPQGPKTHFALAGPMLRAVFSRDPKVQFHALMTMLYPKSFLATNVRTDDHGEMTVCELLQKYHQKRDEVCGGVPEAAFRGFVGQSLACMTHHVRKTQLQTIRSHGFPILIVGGQQDFMIPIKLTMRMVPPLKGDNMRMVVFPDSGHGVQLQHVDEVVQELLTTIDLAGKCRRTRHSRKSQSKTPQSKTPRTKTPKSKRF